MTVKKSDWVNGKKPMPTPMGSEVVNVLLSLSVAADEIAANDVYIMGELPEDCVLVDAVYAATDLDTHATTPTVVMSFGTINADQDDLATAMETGLAIGKAGTAARMTPTRTTMTTKSGSTGGTKLGYKVTTAADTGAAGTVYLSLSYRSVAHDA